MAPKPAMRALAVVALLALAGCATKPPASPATKVPEVALVATPTACPAPVLPPKPRLPYEDLPAAATDGETIEALTKSLKLCGEYSEKLQTILKGYNK